MKHTGIYQDDLNENVTVVSSDDGTWPATKADRVVTDSAGARFVSGVSATVPGAITTLGLSCFASGNQPSLPVSGNIDEVLIQEGVK